MGAWLHLVGNLTGKAGIRLVGHIGDQLCATQAGAELVRQLVSGETDAATAREAMSEIEHRGDASRVRLVEELTRTLVTPIDREDLFRLSRSIDDVLDNLRDFVREMDLFAVGSIAAYVTAIQGVIDGVDALERSVGYLPKDCRGAAFSALAAKKSASSVRRAYQEGTAQLFTGEIDAGVIKKRELLRRLDIVGLRLGEAADALADGATKRGH